MSLQAAFVPSVPHLRTAFGNSSTPLHSLRTNLNAPPSRRAFVCTDESPSSAVRPRVLIEYCTGCRWGLRAGWMAQELLITFEKELGEVALRPSARSGVFDIWLDNQRIWNRHETHSFPELKHIKQCIRNAIVPNRSLGHSDK